MKILLLQLPIPQLLFGKRSGNIPLGAACLKTAAQNCAQADIRIIPESRASYLGDAALSGLILAEAPDILGFTVFNWNLERSLYLAQAIKRHLAVKIVFGGPEITSDNPLVQVPEVDFLAFGEGEAVFLNLIHNPEYWHRKSSSAPADDIFRSAVSPYFAGYLEPRIENMMLLETQRGCPYRCGFCYYNKSQRNIAAISGEKVTQGISWAREQGLGEVFLLDPSFNARPDLRPLLEAIGAVNADGRTLLSSEMRAEAVDARLARQLAKAGFGEFEVGLQTITPAALKLMQRPLDLEQFKTGVACLQQEGICAKIDLIIGLPGDNLAGFKATVDFMAEHGMAEEVQVFFLSVLPGTRFRQKSRELGLRYQPRPPYTIIETAGFRSEELTEAFFYAEDVFDTALNPEAEIDLAYYCDVTAKTDASPYIRKVVLLEPTTLAQLQELAPRLTSPYQVFFGATIADAYICDVMSTLTASNPHTPLEIVFLNPPCIPNVEQIEQALNLARPLYLDLDLPAVGSRSVLFTLVTPETEPVFGGLMKRQVFCWRQPRLPDEQDIRSLSFADGVLLDNRLPRPAWEAWQHQFADLADQLPHISFAELALQERWLRLTNADAYWIERTTIAGLHSPLGP